MSAIDNIYAECGWFVQDNAIAPLGYCYQISDSVGYKESYLFDCIDNKRYIFRYDGLDCQDVVSNETGKILHLR